MTCALEPAGCLPWESRCSHCPLRAPQGPGLEGPGRGGLDQVLLCLVSQQGLRDKAGGESTCEVVYFQSVPLICSRGAGVS